jgi:hypothetical protein
VDKAGVRALVHRLSLALKHSLPNTFTKQSQPFRVPEAVSRRNNSTAVPVADRAELKIAFIPLVDPDSRSFHHTNLSLAFLLP